MTLEHTTIWHNHWDKANKQYVNTPHDAVIWNPDTTEELLEWANAFDSYGSLTGDLMKTPVLHDPEQSVLKVDGQFDWQYMDPGDAIAYCDEYEFVFPIGLTYEEL